MIFEKPMLEVIDIKNDVITASGGCSPTCALYCELNEQSKPNP